MRRHDHTITHVYSASQCPVCGCWSVDPCCGGTTAPEAPAALLRVEETRASRPRTQHPLTEWLARVA